MSMRAVLRYMIVLVSVIGIVDAATPDYVPGELLVRFAPRSEGRQMVTAEQEQIIKASVGGGTITQSFRIVPGLTLVKLPSEIAIEDALKTFNNTDGILNAQPNYIFHATSTFPNDTRFAELWGMHNTGQTGGTPDADIDAPEAWDITHDASNIIVAVIDTGIDYTHPDLAANIWVNPGEIPANGIDDDHNGKPDDVYGYDFCSWPAIRLSGRKKPQEKLYKAGAECYNNIEGSGTNLTSVGEGII